MAEVKWIKITTSMFDDEKIKIIESMPDADSILVIWVKLLTQAGKNNSNGFIFLAENIPYTDEMLSTLFNRPLNTIRLALQTFKQFGMIDFDDNNFLYLVNWEKHQNIEGLDKIREQTRKRVAKHRENHKALVTDVTLPVTQRNATDIDKSKKKKEDKIYTPDSQEYILSQYLFKKMLENNPTVKEPDLNKWAINMDKLLRIDNRPPEEVMAVIDFCQADTFWKSNILSVAKLREKYDQLNIKRKSSKPTNNYNHSEMEGYKDAGEW